MEEIYNMKLFDRLTVGECDVTRVPGGWIINQVFVPYNNEFLPKVKKETKTHYEEGYLGFPFSLPKILPDQIKESHLRYGLRLYLQERGEYNEENKVIAKEFLKYWEARDKSGKMAYEKQLEKKAFSAPLRWSTWKQRTNETPNNQNNVITKKREELT